MLTVQCAKSKICSRLIILKPLYINTLFSFNVNRLFTEVAVIRVEHSITSALTPLAKPFVLLYYGSSKGQKSAFIQLDT